MSLFSLVVLSCISGSSRGFAPGTPLSASSSRPLTEDHLAIARLCDDVYSSEVESLDSFVESKDTGVQATVSLDKKADRRRAVVCFRGSNEARDWYLNLNVGKVPFVSRKHADSSKMVHAGFFVGHNSIKAKVYAKLNAIVDSGECDRILFCGHSLGSAMSVLSAFDFVNTRGLPVEVVTFGSPRIGNRSFAESFDAQFDCLRVVNDRDVVPTAPLRCMDFFHVGRTTVHLREGDEAAVVLGKEAESSATGSLLERLSWRVEGMLDLDFGVRDHMMARYVEEMESHLGRADRPLAGDRLANARN